LILLLGVTGDVGSVVAPRLRAAGYEVSSPSSRDLDLSDSSAVEDYLGSLPQGYGLLFFAFIDRRRGETFKEYELNQRIVENVLKFGKPGWMMFASSIAVYGEHPSLPITETSPLIGEGLYARAKREAEARIAAINDAYPKLIVRLPGVFGGHGRRNQSLDRILWTGVKTGVIDLQGNGGVLRDWVSAFEVADFIKLFAQNPRSGLVNFVRGESIKIDDYVSAALEVLSQVCHHRTTDVEASGTKNFVFSNRLLSSLFPEWNFPDRKRDIHALALELEKLRVSKGLS